MLNTQSIVLKMLLHTSDKKLALTAFAKLKKHFFNDAFSNIYSSINNFYLKHNTMPSIDSLLLESSRNSKLHHALLVLSNTEIPDVALLHAISILQNEFTQSEFLNLLSNNILEDLTMLDSEDILSRIVSISSELESRINLSDNLYNANQLTVFKTKEEHEQLLIPLGINNDWDALYGGIARSELLLVGGWRGSGKSVFCSNLQVRQYENGNIAPYFTIEMTAEEVFKRNLTIMSGVPALSLRNNNLTNSELHKVALTRALMYIGGEEFYKKYISKYTIKSLEDLHDMENELNSEYSLHTDMLIFDDRDLTLPTVDTTMTGIVSKYGDKVTHFIIDYANQVRVSDSSLATDMYDWKDQMMVPKGAKNIARKLNLGCIMPFQTTEDNKVRLSQGILDACDLAIVLKGYKAEDNIRGAIEIDTIKARNQPASNCISPIDWSKLTIDNKINLTQGDIIEITGAVKEESKKKKSNKEPTMELTL